MGQQAGKEKRTAAEREVEALPEAEAEKLASYSRGKYSSQDVQKAWREWQLRQQDADEEGFTPQQFQKVLVELRVLPAYIPEETKKFFCSQCFKLFDADANGKLHFKEYYMGLSFFLEGEIGDKLGLLFGLYDENGDDTLEKQELLKMLRQTTRSALRILEACRLTTIQELKDAPSNRTHEKERDIAQLEKDIGILKEALQKERLERLCDSAFAADVNRDGKISRSEWVAWGRGDSETAQFIRFLSASLFEFWKRYDPLRDGGPNRSLAQSTLDLAQSFNDVE